MARSGAGRYVGAFVLLVIVAGMLFMYNKMLSKAKSSTATAQQTVPVAVQQRRDEPPEQRTAPERDGDPGLPAVWAYEIKAEYPHDKRAYLQGLAYHDGKLYESTGIYGETTVREVELKTGKVVKSTALGREHFGEGLTVYQALPSLLPPRWFVAAERPVVGCRATCTHSRGGALAASDST